MNTCTVLLFTKDEVLHQLIKKEAAFHSIELVCFEKDTDALVYLCKENVQACIIVEMIPDFNLYYEIRFIRAGVPLLIISPNISAEEKVKIHELGCDTYTKDTIDERDVIMRIASMIRAEEVKANMHSVKIPARDVLKIGQSSIDFRKRQLLIKNKSVRIPQKQVDLLELFCLNKGGLITKEIIAKEVWNTEKDMSVSLLVYIHRLRKLFKDDPYIEIQNVHGLGYVFLEKSVL